MSKRLIRLTSRALGEPVGVRVYVYDDLAHMRRDAMAFSGDASNENAAAVTHAWVDSEGRAGLITMRLWRKALGTEVIAHEMHHVSTALYGATLPDKVDRAEVLNHHNEPFAYLHGELVRRLVDRLYALGYYGED
jgi:hypothetical protein